MNRLLELNANQQRVLLLSIMNSISDGVMMADAGGSFLLMNPAAHSITGTMATNAPPEMWSQVFGCYLPDGTTRVAAEEFPLLRAMRGELIQDEELILKNQFLPHPVWLSVSGRPLEEMEGQLSRGGVLILKDITDRKRIEEEMKRSHDELQQFAYVAAHDLQEPLRTVVSYLDLLNERYHDKLDQKGEKYITNAVSGAKRMQTLISDLLSYSRVATKSQSMTPVDCGQLLVSILEDLRATVSGSQATIECGDLPVVIADQAQLSHVFQNLISNAIKYRSGPPIIKIAATRVDSDWLFTVHDNGIGFEMQYAERIFLIFQRLHGRTEYEGTGIGLAICRRIIARHGGRIWAESIPEKGSTFSFTIPALILGEK
jgi:signal transduction histidine kinase